MKKLKRFTAFLLAFLLTAAGGNLPAVTVYAEETATATEITSLQYDVTVADVTDETSFEWCSVAAGWSSANSTVNLDGDGSYTFTLSYGSTAGFINPGYISTIDGSNMTVTIDKITVNGTYELFFSSPRVLKAGSSWENGLPNIWSGLSDKAILCSSADQSSYLARDAANDLIAFYVTGNSTDTDTDDTASAPTASQLYVEAMGHGWNLGNSFDGVNMDLSEEDMGETAWSNPVVTKELLASVKAKGYDSIRIPMTLYRRYTVNENAGADEYKYVIDESWLARYKEVVDQATEAGLYVMINIHHDSWIWLSDWDGDTQSEEYRMFTDFWKQLSAYFADEPETVCFETINEPSFSASGDISAQDKLDAINLAAYHIIRETSGNESRMIVMPTMSTNHEQGAPLSTLITSLKDDHIIATVHYYSEWVYSANLGKTEFDEVLWQNGSSDYTARDSVDSLMSTLNKQFLSKGIGVIIGEYGLLGYDTSETCLQTGEELKYYEYINEKARENKVCLMFWDNGSGIDRTSDDLSWKNSLVGTMLEASMTGRSSYSTGLDTLYFNDTVTDDTTLALTLNGNHFTGIEGLTEGVDYTYDADSAVITLKKEYINTVLAAATTYGTAADLTLHFDGGADWHEYLVKYAAPTVGTADGTKSEGITIPITFNGSQVRRVNAYQAAGRVGPNSGWWSYLQYDSSFHVDYTNGSLTFTSDFFADSTVTDGDLRASIEFYDGQTISVWMNISGDYVTCIQTQEGENEVTEDSFQVSDVVCLYAGEDTLPAQYFTMPEKTSVYGTYTNDSTMVTLTGWPATMEFDTNAHEDFTELGLLFRYMDLEKYVTVQFGIKDAPVVESMDLTVGTTAVPDISNLTEDAIISYDIADTTVASVSSDGTVTALQEGSTTLTVTVTQYNRTDSFTADITVTKADTETDNGNTDNANPSDAFKAEITESVTQDSFGHEIRTLTNLSAGGSLKAGTDVLPNGAYFSMEYQTSGEFYELAAGAVQAQLTGCKDYQVLAIDLYTVSGVSMHQLNGTVTVEMALPAGIVPQAGYTIAVYRLNDNGTLTKCSTSVTNERIAFETDHFSTFLITLEALADNSNITAEVIIGTDTDNASSGDTTTSVYEVASSDTTDSSASDSSASDSSASGSSASGSSASGSDTFASGADSTSAASSDASAGTDSSKTATAAQTGDSSPVAEAVLLLFAGFIALAPYFRKRIAQTLHS
jgi:endoglucanase